MSMVPSAEKKTSFCHQMMHDDGLLTLVVFPCICLLCFIFFKLCSYLSKTAAATVNSDLENLLARPFDSTLEDLYISDSDEFFIRREDKAKNSGKSAVRPLRMEQTSTMFD